MMCFLLTLHLGEGQLWPASSNFLWFITSDGGEARFLTAPSPLSYIPFTATEVKDKMTFPQRIKNVLSYILGTNTLSRISEPCYKGCY